MIKSKDNFWPYICASAVPRGTAHEPIFTDLKKKSFFRSQSTHPPPSQGRRQKEYPEVNTSQPKYKYQGVSKKLNQVFGSLNLSASVTNTLSNQPISERLNLDWGEAEEGIIVVSHYLICLRYMLF